jgi:hypothetical protein
LALALGTSGIVSAQTGGFVPGSREIFSTDFSKTAVGDVPKELGRPAGRQKGTEQVVEKDGVHLLRANDLAEFLIRLKEPLPEAFTLEFDLISKTGGAPEDLSFEGTASISRSETSAHVTINSTAIYVVGGKSGDDQTFWMATPSALAETMPETMTHFGVSVDARGIDLYANNRLITSMGGVKFAHGQVLRFAIGGNDDSPVYLGRLRIGAGGTPPTLAGNNSGPSWQNVASSGSTDSSSKSSVAGDSPNTQTEPRSAFQVIVTMGSSGPLVSWPVVPDATGYTVSRQKIGDICCNNDSGRGYLTGSPWQDKQLPSSGSYSYLVLANTPRGFVRAETQVNYTAPTPVNAVVADPMTMATGSVITTGSSGTSGGSGSTTSPTIGGGAATQRGVTDLTGTSGSSTSGGGADRGSSTGGTPTGGTPPPGVPSGGTPSGDTHSAGPADVPAQYRVTLTGFRVARASTESGTTDGKYDEAYASAAVVVYDRKSRAVGARNVVRTREYGDVGNGTFGDRIKAGSATPTGGLWSVNGGENVPAEYDPSDSTVRTPQQDRFPLTVWEGPLATGVEAVLIVPTIWDRDRDGSTFDVWRQPWLSAPLAAFFASSEVDNEMTSTQLTSKVADAVIGPPFLLPLPEATAHIRDRPIGAEPSPPIGPPIGIIYRDRHVMITREKLAALAPGKWTMLSLPFIEPPLPPATGAMYTLYLRVERIQ